MSKDVETKTIPLVFVFNGPTLVPWDVVKDYQNDPAERLEKVLLWQEAKRQGWRFKPGDEVVECNNQTLKMTIRQILREKCKATDNPVDDKDSPPRRLIGFECYWWASLDEAFLQYQSISMRAARRVPAPESLEETKV